MAPLRRDGQIDLGMTPLEFAAQQQAKADKRSGRKVKAEVTEAEILSGPGGMTPMEFAEWMAAHPNEGGTQLGADTPGANAAGDGGGGSLITAVAGEGVSPLAQPVS